ncbi:MAG: hypothetical protein ABL888_05415 [Pirellulaceae bacterium]
MSDTTNSHRDTPASTSNRIFAAIAILIGTLLVLGGLMFLFVTYLIRDPDFPLAFTIVPFVQILMGILAAFSGLMNLKNIRGSGWLFAFSIVVVILNCAYLILAVLPFLQPA